MLAFSEDPHLAEQQLHAVIYYMTALGYIDGSFDPSEKAFVRNYIHTLVAHRIEIVCAGLDAPQRASLTAQYTKHFHDVFHSIDYGIRELFTESVSSEEDAAEFVYAKLKLRSFEIFKNFNPENRIQLLSLVDTLIAADGQTHPNEARFREELHLLLAAEPEVDEGPLQAVVPQTMSFEGKTVKNPKSDNHPLFERIEWRHTREPTQKEAQVAHDLSLVRATIDLFAKQRSAGERLLTGRHTVADLVGLEPFLDGNVYGLAPKGDRYYELIVLGDTHGCYSCLKAALMQSDFLAKVDAYQRDPSLNPDPKLILLGDYIDRGYFSFDGVMRTAMELFLRYPSHVYLLRGNHEYFVWHNERIMGGVRPAEAIATYQHYYPPEVLGEYKRLFELMPHALLFDRILFAHAGIPRDELTQSRWTDLSTLNDKDVRFQMLWSDPSEADYIPPALQNKTARFPFGKQQFRSFMARLGTNTMIRGHEKIDDGFKKIYDDGQVLLLNLFSAGGASNVDLPPTSSYRQVTPMALSIRHWGGHSTATPWAIDWARYNDPAKNGFLRQAPEIEFRVE